jgi:hypothetical protein
VKKIPENTIIDLPHIWDPIEWFKAKPLDVKEETIERWRVIYRECFSKHELNRSNEMTVEDIVRMFLVEKGFNRVALDEAILCAKLDPNMKDHQQVWDTSHDKYPRVLIATLIMVVTHEYERNYNEG